MIESTEDLIWSRAQERYRLISENAADVIWMWDLEEGRCVYVSPSVQQLRGFSYSRMLLGRLKAGDPLRNGLEEIHKAGERAAGLTQQLLAFSRKQILQPRVLDLNRVVEEMRPMLERLMGEDVEVRVQLQAEAATICADPLQLEQVLMNLAGNSRDAMPDGGEFSIETGFVEWDESHAPLRPGTHAGPYVMLAVSDTGGGMSQETRGHIFEPFFTTKEVGKGTGVGLSTIHGIVEQSGGYIEVASELGHGTTFKIYMPRVVDAQADSGKPEAAAAMGGNETVLVVEDQAEVREYAAASSAFPRKLHAPGITRSVITRSTRSASASLRIIAISGALGGQFLEVARKLGAQASQF